MKITEEQIAKTRDLLERTLRLQAKAKPDEQYGFEYYGKIEGVTLYKYVDDPGAQYGLKMEYRITAYFDLDSAKGLERLEAKIKEEEDAHK